MPFRVNDRVTRINGPPEFRSTINKSGEILFIVASTSSNGWTIPSLYCVNFDSGENQILTEDQFILEGAPRPGPVVPPVAVTVAGPGSHVAYYIDDDDDDLPEVIKGGERVLIDGTRPAIISRRKAGNRYDVRYEDNGDYEMGVDISRITRGLRKMKPSKHSSSKPASSGPYIGQKIRVGNQPGLITKLSGDYIYYRSDITGIESSVHVDATYYALL